MSAWYSVVKCLTIKLKFGVRFLFIWLKTSLVSSGQSQYWQSSYNRDIYCRVRLLVSGQWGEKMGQRLGDM